MFSEDSQIAVVEQARRFLPEAPEELLSMVFEPSTFDAVLLTVNHLKTGGFVSNLAPGIDKKWQAPGWLLIYVGTDNSPSANFQKITGALGRASLVGFIDIERHVYNARGLFENKFSIDMPDVFLIFHDGRPVYRSHYGALICEALGEPAAQKNINLNDIEDKQLDQIFAKVKKGDLTFSHKRLLEMYVVCFMLLKQHVVTVENQFTTNCVGFFLAQFKYAYGVSTKSWNPLEYPWKGPAVIRELKKIGTQYDIPHRFKGVFSLKECQNILFLRLFKQMRTDTAHRVQIKSTFLRTTVYRGFMSDTNADANNMISQVAFVEYCYLIQRTCKRLKPGGGAGQPAQKTKLDQLWIGFDVSELDKYRLSTDKAMDVEKHQFLAQLKGTLIKIHELIRTGKL